MGLDSGSSAARMPRLAAPLLRTQPDARLAELAGEGGRAAFEELAGRYRCRLVAFAGGIAPPGAADDVVQDAILKAYLALQRGDRPENPKAWLFTIVRNTALNHRRGWRPHDELDETIDGVEQPPDAAERRRRFGSLMVAMGELPRAQREAIVQRELEGRGHEEIAGEMGVSAGAVRQLIHRARLTLRASAAALVPMSLLRLVALPGAIEPAAGGIGATAVKMGLGAVLAAGAIAGGGEVARELDPKGDSNQAVASVEPGSAYSSAADPAGGAGADGARTGEDRDRSDPARDGSQRARPPAQHRQQPPPPRDPAHQRRGDTSGNTTQGEQTFGDGGGYQPPPDDDGGGSGDTTGGSGGGSRDGGGPPLPAGGAPRAPVPPLP